MKTAFVNAVLVAILACGTPTGAVNGELTVRVAPPLLQLTNHSPAAIYFFTIDRTAAAYTDWGPCSDPTTCPAIDTGRTVAVPYSQIAGYGTSREAVVYWWHLVAGGQTTFRPDSIRAIVVGL